MLFGRSSRGNGLVPRRGDGEGKKRIFVRIPITEHLHFNPGERDQVVLSRLMNSGVPAMMNQHPRQPQVATLRPPVPNISHDHA